MTQRQESTPEHLFADAESLLDSALQELEAGKIRDAAEKAWGATVRSTNGLILARTGEEPPVTALTSRGLRELAEKDSEVDRLLIGRYYTRQSVLHGECFYTGVCEPKGEIERRIRETADYVRDARGLAKR